MPDEHVLRHPGDLVLRQIQHRQVLQICQRLLWYRRQLVIPQVQTPQTRLLAGQRLRLQTLDLTAAELQISYAESGERPVPQYSDRAVVHVEEVDARLRRGEAT